MSTQVQIRRDSAANLASVTPVAGEAGYDTTNKNLIVGDGSRVGGIPHPSYAHIQKQRFTFATSVGGTANAITIDLAEDLDAYAQGVAIEFEAASTNTGLVTVDVSGLGVKTLKRLAGGSLTDLSAGQIVSGGIYRIVYDGTYFQLGSGGGGGIAITRQVFISSGTWTKPSGLLYADVEVIGGGGGGGGTDAASGTNTNCGGGGGGGGYSRKIIISSSLSGTETVTIGSGGAGGNGTTPTNGSSGGTSSFGAYCSASGGSGGSLNNSTSATNAAAGGSGGSGSGGDFNIVGGGGGGGISVSAGVGISGAGGCSAFGGGGSSRASNGTGNAGNNYGGGGGGAHSTGASGQSGGAGKSGIVIVTEYSTT